MRLSLTVEFIDCDMTRQCKYLETLWSFAIFSRVPTQIVYRDYYIGKILSRRKIKYTFRSNYQIPTYTFKLSWDILQIIQIGKYYKSRDINSEF